MKRNKRGKWDEEEEEEDTPLSATLEGQRGKPQGSFSKSTKPPGAKTCNRHRAEKVGKRAPPLPADSLLSPSQTPGLSHLS